ncbi:MAG: methyltransferase domain-containing protein [Bacteroidia bacterium]|nr:methyltransferase domain-containing protein [Bacteroidia bacterium]
MKDKQISYYAQRAHEYEKIYHKAERQEDLRKLELLLPQLVKTKSVLEIGCGTAYWTQFMSQTANSILASDINESVLEIAKTKSYPTNPEFILGDYEQLDELEGQFDLIFAGFVVSHIRREHLENFISRLSSKLKRGGEIIFMDNVFVEGSSTPISESDEWGNTFQERKLDDGKAFRVLKNFYQKEDWKKLLKKPVEFNQLKFTYFYLLQIKHVK